MWSRNIWFCSFDISVTVVGIALFLLPIEIDGLIKGYDGRGSKVRAMVSWETVMADAYSCLQGSSSVLLPAPRFIQRANRSFLYNVFERFGIFLIRKDWRKAYDPILNRNRAEVDLPMIHAPFRSHRSGTVRYAHSSLSRCMP